MNEVEEIKERIDIVEFIRGYLELRKTGVNYKAPCPFHTERTPSFMVNPERKIFKCFGCGEAGDVFTFLMKMEGLNFPEALEMLAGRAGVILPKQRKSPVEYQKEKDTKTRLFEINDWAAKVFHEILVNHKIAENARQYLARRKINANTIKEWQIGYAPPKPILAAYLTKKGYHQNEIGQAGSPDRFRDRIIFPIVDLVDNIVGFTGRALGAGQEPKYYNSPESLIYHKGKILYGLNLAKAEIRAKKQAILVEGQTDVVLSHQAGVTNVVASSGTALTSDHLKILARYTPNIIFCFDNDEAGFIACNKAIIMAYDLELAPRVVEIPSDFKDVGEVIEKDEKLWTKVSQKSQPAFEWFMEKIFSDYDEGPNASQRREIAKELLGVLVHVLDPVEQRHYKKMLGQKLGVSEKIVEEALNKFISKQRNPSISLRTGSETGGQKNKEVEKQKEKLGAEETLVGLLLTRPEHAGQVIENLDYQEFGQNPNMSAIYKAMESCYTLDNGGSRGQSLQEKGKIHQCLAKKLSSVLTKEVDFLIIQTEERIKDYSEEEITEEVLDCVARIKSRKKEKIKSNYASAIARAEAEGDRGKLKELLDRFQKEISRK